MKLQQSLTILLCTALVILSLLQCTSALRNNLIRGRKGPNDKLLQQDSIKKDWSLGGNVEAVYSYTHPGNTRISYIEVLDQATNGHGAKPDIISGGIGYNFVDIKFRSEVFRGIDFIVKIYAP